MPFLRNTLGRGGVITLRGRIVRKKDALVMEHPEIFYPSASYEEKRNTMQPVYALTAGLTNNAVKKAVAQALEQVEKENPDLVLLDVMMPDMSGFEVAQHLKSNPNTADIPIIFLTALNSTADIVKGFQVGANDFISKPFNKEELIIRVTHQISLVAAKRLILSKTEELQRTIAGRDKLYSVIAHDLRSPMGSIKMVLNMLILNLPSEKIGAEMYELLTMANQTTEDVFSLLDNLLKWTKCQIGKLNVVYQDVDLVEVTDGVIEIFSMVASLKKIRIREMKPEKMMVNADIDMLKTVVRNLLSNAIKFSKENSEVLVKMEEVDGMAVVSVQDYGCGISEEGQKKLLHTDTHFSTFGTNNEEGSGLGLLLCKDFVVKNGGKLWFTSKEGEGSIFSFSIPVKK
jgi:two-component system sensor histidine kinase/response regulator